MSDKIPIIVVCGPTAVGKTHFAVQLALQFNGEIISADSRQLYRGMNIGTGKDLEEYHTPMGFVPYHLIDVADPQAIVTLHHYQKMCFQALREIVSRGKLPFLVGGSGLYVESVLRGFNIPKAPPDEVLRKKLQRMPKETLVRILAQKSEELLQKTDVSSKKRVIRALEIAHWREHHGLSAAPQARHIPEVESLVIALTLPKKILKQRIKQRLEKRLAHGLIEEVQQLLRLNIDRRRWDMFGMEYAYVTRYLEGLLSFEQMKSQLERAIIKLAKRQMTWFRGMERRGVVMQWLTPDAHTLASTATRRFTESVKKVNT